MAVWLLVSAAYPVFVLAMLIKAFRHFRRRRAQVPYRFLSSQADLSPERKPPATDDWVPAR